jgi:hypothetical protein
MLRKNCILSTFVTWCFGGKLPVKKNITTDKITYLKFSDNFAIK